MAEYIKRSKVFEAYNEEQKRIGSWRFETLIESIPAEDVAPVVHGRWEYVCGDEFSETYKCKKCEHEFDICVEMYRESLPNYCPSCGAKMEEAR